MLIKALRPLSALLMTTLFSLSTVAADASLARGFWQPGEFELKRRHQAQIEHDNQQVDGALQEILPLLGLKNSSSERIVKAARYLNNLVNIHKTRELGTQDRQDDLAELAIQAKRAYANLGKKPQNLKELDMKAIMDDGSIDLVVKTFINDYFAGLHEYKHEEACVSAAAIIGLSVGAGFGMITYLGGERYITGCLTLGGAGIPPGAVRECAWVSGDVSLEYDRGESRSCWSSTHRLHEAVLAGMVNDIAEVKGPNLNGYVVEDNGIDGVAVGLGALEVNAGTYEHSLFPWTSSYHFARKHLGITHEADAGGH